MNLVGMLGNSNPTPSPNTLTDGYGGSGHHYREAEERRILDIINDDEEAVMLVIMGFVKANMRKKVKLNQCLYRTA